jgi:hypothetical protein
VTDALAGIDHVIAGVRDLEIAREAWRRLGFILSPRGRHIDQPTGNDCMMFPSDHSELLGVVDPDYSAHRLRNFLAWREGLVGLALAPVGSAEEARAALSRGLHPSEPRPLARQIELPEGTGLPGQQIAFAEMPNGSLALPAREANGAILLFAEG